MPQTELTLNSNSSQKLCNMEIQQYNLEAMTVLEILLELLFMNDIV